MLSPSGAALIAPPWLTDKSLLVALQDGVAAYPLPPGLR
jgi:hypothetical protein